MTTLKAALQEVCFMELEDIPSEEELSTNETLTFSPAFVKKMKKLIHRADHPIRYRIIRAAVCVLLAAVLSGCTVLAFVPEARASFSRWVKEVYETHIVYRYAGEGNHFDSTASEEYRPTWIPNGYEEYYTSNSENDFTVVYANDIGQNLTFSYSTDKTNSIWYIENLMIATKQVYVNEVPADILIADNIETGSAIVWVDSQNIAFYISAFLDEADLIRMAESVHKKYFPEVLSRYKITELPDGFAESERTEFPRTASITYKNESGDVIFFNYSFMAQGGATFFDTKDSDIFDIEVHHMSGQFFESKTPGNFNTITWIDEDQNIQFDISGEYSYADILRMAKSVSLAKTKNENPQLDEIEFDYLPDGMSEIGRDYIPQTHYQAIWFEDSMGRRFEISQDIMTSNKQSTLILATEDAEATKIDFNGYDATLIIKGEQTMLLCVDDDSCVLLSGDFPPGEIIKIANGVNILNK